MNNTTCRWNQPILEFMSFNKACRVIWARWLKQHTLERSHKVCRRGASIGDLPFNFSWWNPSFWKIRSLFLILGFTCLIVKSSIKIHVYIYMYVYIYIYIHMICSFCSWLHQATSTFFPSFPAVSLLGPGNEYAHTGGSDRRLMARWLHLGGGDYGWPWKTGEEDPTWGFFRLFKWIFHGIFDGYSVARW